MIKNRGYYIEKSKFTEDDIKKIKLELTVEPKESTFVNKQIVDNPNNEENQDKDEDDKKYKLYVNTKKYLILPRFYGQNKFGKCEIKIIDNPININFKGSLRDYQVPIVNLMEQHILKSGGGLLSVPCGRGKTLMAIYLITKLKLKTLVVVHKSFLLDQWIKSINTFTDAKTGTIRGPIIDVENKDIVIGMLQSLSMKDYDDKLFENFNFVIYDEAHHAASKVFSRCLMKIGGKYTLALSATPYRGDGLIKIIHWFLGDIIYRESVRINEQVLVKIFNYKSSDKKFKEIIFNWGIQKGKPNVIKMMSNLVELEERTDHIVKIILEILNDPTRKIIILSERISHLTTMKEKLDKLLTEKIKRGEILENEIKTFYYIGELKKKEREIAEKECDVLFATYAMAKEGLDIERLNTVVLATSQRDVIQSVGRVMRKILGVGDNRPLIVDFTDYVSSFINQKRQRVKFYQQSHFEIENYYIQDKNLTNDSHEKDDSLNLKEILDIDKISDDMLNKKTTKKKTKEDDTPKGFNIKKRLF
jgi:superfamily II DNA or RNA helicase